ncbi:MAG: 4Fe-4S binding protein [Erysipelotrichaceae bacterium]
MNIDKEKCTGCMSCMDVCEYDAIIIEEDNKPKICIEYCLNCGLCQSICCDDAIKVIL